jgi:hypothetical protein
MQTSKCPECKEEIGGSKHALLKTNKFAGEMDDAKYPAWSETANNLANFRIDDF